MSPLARSISASVIRAFRRATRTRNTPGSRYQSIPWRSRDFSSVVLVGTPLFLLPFLSIVRLGVYLSRHARYLLIVALGESEPRRRRRRAERRAPRRDSATRSASTARAFLSLERPRGSPVRYLTRCFGVGRVAYCPGEPRLRSPQQAFPRMTRRRVPPFPFSSALGFYPPFPSLPPSLPHSFSLALPLCLYPHRQLISHSFHFSMRDVTML